MRLVARAVAPIGIFAMGACSLATSFDGLTGGNLGDAAVDAPTDGATATPLSGDVHLSYASTNGTPAIVARTWDHVAHSWSTPSDVLATSAVVPWVASRAHGSSELVGSLLGSGTGSSLDVREDSAGTYSPLFTATGISASNGVRRGFDIAFEGTSGDALAVYSDGSAIPRFRTAGTWSTDAPVFTSPPASGAVIWIQLAASLVSDEMTLVYANDATQLFAVVWNGNAWSSPTMLEPTLNTIDWQCFAAAYEGLTGNLVVAWGKISSSPWALYWSYKLAGATSFAAVQSETSLFPAGPMASASQPGSNRIALAYDEFTCGGGTCDDFIAATWDGASWVDESHLDGNITTSYAANVGSAPVSVAWLGANGPAIAVYAHPSSGISWAKWSAGQGWKLQPDGSVSPAFTADKVSQQFVSLSAADGAMLIITDTNGALWSKRCDGNEWSDTENGAALGTVGSFQGVPFGAVLR